VEIGGWDRMNYWRNPPPQWREREVARFPAWLTQIGLSLPRLVLLGASAEPLGDDTWRVRCAVGNAGYLPSHVTRRALERKTARPCIFELDLPEGAELLLGQRRVEGPQLDGHAPPQSLQSFWPPRGGTTDRAQAEWVVRAAPGAELHLRVHAGRAGAVRTMVALT
jgi:hypothetical protein